MENYESIQDEHIIDRFWTLPNVISMIRLLMIPVIIWSLTRDTGSYDLLAFFLIGTAYFSDFLDGYLARKMGQVSRFGKIIDPVCDKVITIALAVSLFALGKLPLYFFIIVILRDVLIGIGSIVAMQKSHQLPLPLLWGKLSTFVYGIVIAFYPLHGSSILDRSASWITPVVNAVVIYGTWLSSVLIILSFVIYTISYIQNVSMKKKSQ